MSAAEERDDSPSRSLAKILAYIVTMAARARYYDDVLAGRARVWDALPCELSHESHAGGILASLLDELPKATLARVLFIADLGAMPGEVAITPAADADREALANALLEARDVLPERLVRGAHHALAAGMDLTAAADAPEARA